MDDTGVHRCAAARGCRSPDATNIYDPDTDELTDRLGQLIAAGPLCETCVRTCGQAIRNLPGDVAELSQLLTPTSEWRLTDPEMPRQNPILSEPELPLRADVFVLQQLIAYETTVWADAVADADGLDWASWDDRCTRQLPRVDRACQLLCAKMATLVALPAQTHRARSLYVRRADGHDPEHTTRDAIDYWVTRQGWAGALRLRELHDRAERFAGRHPGDREPTPCPRCHRRALIREHRQRRVSCRFCGDQFSDDAFCTLRNAALRAYGIPSRDEEAAG